MVDKINNLDHLLKNPMLTQSLALRDLQERHGSGNKIVDGNNVPCWMLETMCNLVSGATQEMIRMNNDSYSKRATTSKELYRHMSQWDYVGLYSLPSSTNLRLLLDKKYIIDHSVSYNSNYNKIIIPSTSKFTIGGIDFGIYYPIEIKINKLTNTFLISHDTSMDSPLKTLVDNTIKHTEMHLHDMAMIDMEFPVYQFRRRIYTETLVKGQGYTNKWELQNKFYAVVITHLKNKRWSPIGQTLSDMSYDPFTPTAKLRVNLDENTISINIPQIYFSNGTIGTNLKVEIYETKGELDINIGNIKPSDLSFTLGDIGEGTLAYTEILNRIPVREVLPTTNRISGGSNGWTFEELRDKVINDAFTTEAAITLPRMKNLFTNKETTVTKQLDNLTARNFIAHSPIKDAEGIHLPAGNLRTNISELSIEACTHIKTNSDNSVTVLPAILYKLNGNIAEPVCDMERATFDARSIEQRVSILNDSQYTFSPFHIRLSVEDEFPVASIYELTNPAIQEIVFVSENVEISTQLTIMNGIIIHNLLETEKFIVRIGVLKSNDLKDVIEDNIRIRGYTTDPNSGEEFYIDAVKSSEVEKVTYYDFVLTTEYDINKFHRILINSFNRTSGGNSNGCYIDMKFSLMVSLEVRSSNILGSTLSPSEFVTTIRQDLTIVLGKRLNSTIDPSVDINYTDIKYQTYPETIYKKYTSDVYEYDDEGKLIFIVFDGAVELNKLFSEGDDIVDEFGHKIVAHLAGDMVLDYRGNGIVVKERTSIYAINMLHIDYRLLYDNSTDPSMIGINLSEMIGHYLEELSRVQKDLLEKTYMFFEPICTIGNSNYVTKKNTFVNQPLNVTMHLVLYVSTKTIDNIEMINSLKSSVVNIIRAHVESGTISISLIQDEIISSLGDQILSIDNYGINGDPELQTLINVNDKTKSIVARKLTFNTDNTIHYVEDLIIETVSTGDLNAFS